MLRFVMRMLTPSRLRRAFWSRVDARYVGKLDHRQDIKDTLWEVQMLRREVVALRGEVDRLWQTNKSSPEAHRLARETAEALDRVLQSEVRIWQAIDGLSAQLAEGRLVEGRLVEGRLAEAQFTSS